MTTRRRLQIVLLLLTLVFIWGQSCLPKADSAAESQRVMMLIAPILEPFAGKGGVTVHLVRKVAHFVEFAILGFQLLLLWHDNIRRDILRSLELGFIAAFLDESIQMLSGRGAQIIDVWLDAGGVAFGVAVGAMITLLRKRLKLQKE